MSNTHSLSTWYYAPTSQGLKKIPARIAESLIRASQLGDSPEHPVPESWVTRDATGNGWVLLIGAVVALQNRRATHVLHMGVDGCLVDAADGLPWWEARALPQSAEAPSLCTLLAQEVTERTGAPRDGERDLAGFLYVQGPNLLPARQAAYSGEATCHGTYRDMVAEMEGRFGAEAFAWDLRRAQPVHGTTLSNPPQEGDPLALLVAADKPRSEDWDAGLRMAIEGSLPWSYEGYCFIQGYQTMTWDAAWGKRPGLMEVIRETYGHEDRSVHLAHLIRYCAIELFIDAHRCELVERCLARWTNMRSREIAVEEEVVRALVELPFHRTGLDTDGAERWSLSGVLEIVEKEHRLHQMVADMMAAA